MRTLIEEFLQQRVITPVPQQEEGLGCYSHVFLVKKPSGKFRLILNLKILNKSIRYKRFRMDSIYSVRKLLPAGCFLASIDLRDAYLHVPIRTSSQRYLRLAISTGKEVKHFQFRALPFGLSSSPRVFTKVVAEALAPLRLEGVSIIPYLDDLLLFAKSENRLLRDLGKTQSHLEGLGWILNMEKSNLVPSQVIIFLGYSIDSIQKKIFLPEEKIVKVQAAVKTVQTNLPVTVRKAMSTLGLLTAAIPAVQWARLHARDLQQAILQNWSFGESLEKQFLVPPHVKRKLWWWRTRTNLSLGLLWTFPMTKVLTTDASSWGWGAHLEGQMAQGSWSREDSRRSSNWRELKAIFMALEAFSQVLQGQHVQVLSDNATAVAYISRQGGTRSRCLLNLAFQILYWSEVNVASLSAVHLKGNLNNLADFLSRQRVLESEWSLNQEVFQEIVDRWGTPQIDLFASQVNAKVPRFFSLNRLDQAEGLDALAQRWSFRLCYAFPPIQIIPLVLKKLQEERTTLILVVPFWPKRPWFSSLLDLAIEGHWLLPVRRDLLFQGPLLHPDASHLKLAVWLLRNKS